jgi:hypothetical protein
MTEKKTDLIAYCGLYCGDCPAYTQTLANLARDMRAELRHYRFGQMADQMSKEPFFEEFKHYDKCYRLLGTMMKLRCTKLCKGNGGPPNCKIRNCARKKGFDGCWQCDDFVSCKNLEILKDNYGSANLRNLRKLRKQGPAAFVKGKRYWHAPK